MNSWSSFCDVASCFTWTELNSVLQNSFLVPEPIFDCILDWIPESKLSLDIIRALLFDSMLNSGDGKFIWPRSIFCMFCLVFKMTLVFNLNSIDLLISAQKLRLSVTQGMLHAYTNTPKWFWRNKIVTFIGNTLHTNNPVLYSEIFGYFRVTFFSSFCYLFPGPLSPLVFFSPLYISFHTSHTHCLHVHSTLSLLRYVFPFQQLRSYRKRQEGSPPARSTNKYKLRRGVCTRNHIPNPRAIRTSLLKCYTSNLWGDWTISCKLSFMSPKSTFVFLHSRVWLWNTHRQTSLWKHLCKDAFMGGDFRGWVLRFETKVCYWL